MSDDAPDLLAALLERVDAPTPGHPAWIVGRAGAGKTPLAVQLSLHALLHEKRVLHVALGDTVDHVRAHYDEVLRTTRGLSGADLATATVTVERRRMILSWAERDFQADHLVAQAQTLAQAAQFSPHLMVVDGLHDAALAAALANASTELDVPTWVTLTGEASDLGDAPHGTVLRLEADPDTDRMVLSIIDGDAREPLPWALDPHTLSLVSPSDDTPALDARSCTLFSGGASGAETAFGEVAARYGLREVNFSFEGHKQARTDGRVELSAREMEAGDVSLVYVSRRLHRTYNQQGLIRKVLQVLWHMVSRSQQVFVIGAIQDDNTVVGGTGWSVELARMWGKEVWVFDQLQDGWFTWTGGTWTPGVPSITTAHVCGTGTRYLEPNGRHAIDGLFARSFGEPQG